MRWYLSFADPDRPKGSQWLGATVVRASSFMEAVLVSKITGCNPGGQVFGHDIPDGKWPTTPPELDGKIVTDPAELDRVMSAWTGVGVAKLSDLEAEAAE